MATPLTQYPAYVQGTASAGTTAIFTGPVGYISTINGITFNSQASNDLTVQITRLNPASTVIAYAFNLSAGDVVSDNNTYTLGAGDTLEIITTAVSTNYMFTANVLSGNSQRVTYL